MLYFEVLRAEADVLLRETREFTRQERMATASLLVRLAAVETRQLYAPCGYSTMWEYCLGELGMSDDAAGRRLWAARKCREFPALFDALADGRIHMTAVHTLAVHLQSDKCGRVDRGGHGPQQGATSRVAGVPIPAARGPDGHPALGLSGATQRGGQHACPDAACAGRV